MMSQAACQISKNRSNAENWRIVKTPSLSSGAANMALDEAVAFSVADRRAPPTLRIYGWSNRTISIGRFQAVSDIDLEAARQHGIEVVRRPTGGKALLHANEVTYSIAFPRGHRLVANGVLQTYLRISQGLSAGLAILGLQVDPLEAGKRRLGSRTAACFEAPSAYEVTVIGKKLIGSAQCNREGYVLQHGSIPLAGSQSELVPYLDLTDAARQDLSLLLDCNSTSLASLTGNSGSRRMDFARSEVEGAIAEGLRHVLCVEFAESRLEPVELEIADQLIRQKYSHDPWTHQK